MHIRLLKISGLVCDSALYPRQKTDWMVSYDYAQAMKAGAKFPPIVAGILDGKSYIVDGWHRAAAAKILKQDYIRAEVRRYSDRKALFIDAVKLNTSHGQRLTMWDKTKIIDQLKKYGITKVEISEITKVPIGNIKRFEARTFTGPNGERIYLKSITEKLCNDSGISASEINQGILTTNNLKMMLKQLIAVLEACPEINDEETLALMKALDVWLDRLLPKNVCVSARAACST